MQSYFVDGTATGERGFAFANPSSIIQYHEQGIPFPKPDGYLHGRKAIEPFDQRIGYLGRLVDKCGYDF